ncbi:hypothetical protein [Desulfogranum marinum]|uniref:hypothetical protein n=1 Tax=Desulfogranum marinum TaxID=453220 RepID=UPI0019627527|nr:hypothetical protein [Desulfogranum marinum]MBM9513237.1 hypothetical protein [Desulfogranum marinum]
MNHTQMQGEASWRQFEPRVLQEAIDLYQELVESGVFKISWDEFFFFWQQWQHDKASPNEMTPEKRSDGLEKYFASM